MAYYAEIFLLFLRLGCSSFGGPAAHLLRFERCFVTEKAWLSAGQYQQLVALCQFLPGPASSQVGMGIGLHRAGLVGAVLAFCGFTLPSFLLMCLAGVAGLTWLPPAALQGAFWGLAAIVAHAVWQMTVSLTPDWPQRLLALLAVPAFFYWQSASAQLAILLCIAGIGAFWLRPVMTAPTVTSPTRRSRSLILLGIFFLLLFALPWFATPDGSAMPLLLLADLCYRAGALVFGGGHVVLPLLQQGSSQLLSASDFLTGYATAQLLPGPLFSFAAYLGVTAGHGISGALLATLMLFLPGALLLCAIFPWWYQLGRVRPLQGAVAAVNSAVVALLAVSWVNLILPHAVTTHWHWLPVVGGVLLLQRRYCPPVLLIPLWSALSVALSLN
ncbi:MAG: chromate efflux transporter [Rheinheimera sp.]|nr:chromate efflux transporter [Rheinheimera sp.]